MRAIKNKAIQKLFLKKECSKIEAINPKSPEIAYTSFVQQRSVQICKLLTDRPSTTVAIMKHVWEQEYKHPEKRKLMNLYWKQNVQLAGLMLDIGKQKGRKNQVKLVQCVNKLKQKYVSLRKASRLTDISWTKFHCQTYVNSTCKSRKNAYICKLSDEQIKSIEDHYQSDNISFPLPDKKYKGKRFMRYSLKHSTRMYNLSQSTTRKISTATYCHYKPKAVKLQGQIPFRQSCCERCQNFENILHEASKYMSGIPSDVGEAIDKSLCEYSGYFPKIDCVTRK